MRKALILVFLSIISCAAYSQSPIRTCQTSRLDSLQWKDLVWMFSQQDSISNLEPYQNLTLILEDAQGIRTEKTFQSDSTFRMNDSVDEYLAQRVLIDKPDLTAFWALELEDDIRLFKSLKDSLHTKFKFRQYAMRYSSETRSLKQQLSLQKRGRSKIALSMHNFSLAADVAIYRKKRYLKRGIMYDKMGAIAKDLGLYWGGDFVGFPDLGHIQAFKNSAALLRQHPNLAFEFEHFKSNYEQIYIQKANLSRVDLVQDTRDLLEAMNEFRMMQPCLCEIARPIPESARYWMESYQQNPKPRIHVNVKEQWAYVQRGNNGYFFPLGRWKPQAKM
ncbi:M15 family metallopeptidase [Aquirufa ecclesiirivi]|uniref:M15 family metallopeptidase n=1 Tax=Aquirufa ecclesiirivi TaxID=2715124 RepID=UPI00140A7667|nr:M15 family metallopeptidase [Aquirufa ecclesiirivi]NHC49337.1 M15 family metallopeptidase [Aquirufa ecclesiirivi]